jgi:signal transduction histidine kinase
MAFIEVANGGALIPEEAVPSLFEPFWRLSGRSGPPGVPVSSNGTVPSNGTVSSDLAVSPDGTGLGLSIVRSVALAHHGQVIARRRAAGGLEVSVLLPARPG